MAPVLSACLPVEAAQPDEGAATRSEAPRPARKAATAIPFIFDSQRILIEVAFEAPDGGSRNALAWFNMGMAAPILSKPLYRELAIGQRQTLNIRIGERIIAATAHDVIDGDGGIGVPDFSHLFAPRRVEAMLPVSLLQNFMVTLDYEHHALALAEPGTQRPDGVAVPCLINPKTGLVAVEAEIGGAVYPLAIDAGSGYSWMRGGHRPAMAGRTSRLAAGPRRGRPSECKYGRFRI